MKIRSIINHVGWSDRIRRRGIRAVAREAKMDFSYLSKIVNDKVVVTEKTLLRLTDATNKLSPKK